MNGLEAKDWFRSRFWPEQYPSGVYSWEEFIRCAVYCTNIQGSALYDATLGDQDLIDQMYEEMVAEQSSKRKKQIEPGEEPRPPRRGYSREVEAIYDLTDNIVALRGEMGKWSRTTTERQMSKRPWFPAEVAQERMRARARHRRDTAIRRAQAHWAAKPHAAR